MRALAAVRLGADPVARNMYLEFAWVGVLNAVILTFTPVFAIRLGATPLLVAALTSGPALVAILVSLPATRLLRSRTLGRVVWARFLSRLPYLALAVLPWLRLDHQAEAVVALVVLSYVPTHVAYLGFTSVFADLIPPARRPTVMGGRLLALGLVGSATVLLGGQLLQALPFPLGYQALFLAGFLTSLVGVWYVRRLSVARSAGTASPDGKAMPIEPAAGVDAPRRPAGSFAAFSLSTFVFQLGIGMAAPLFSLYWVRDLGLSDGWVGLLATGASLASVAGYPLWGRLVARRGNREVLLAALFGHSFYPILTSLTGDAVLLLGVGVLGGLVSSGTTLGLFNGLLEVAPEEDRLRFIAVYNTLTYVALLLGPLAGSVAAELLGVGPALLIAGAVRLLGFIAYALSARREAGWRGASGRLGRGEVSRA